MCPRNRPWRPVRMTRLRDAPIRRSRALAMQYWRTPAADGRASSHLRLARVAGPFAGTFAGAAEAHAEAIRLLPDFGPDIEVYGFALSGGLALFSTFVALAYIAERKAWRRRETELAAKLEATRAQRDRAEIFLSSEQQLFIA